MLMLGALFAFAAVALVLFVLGDSLLERQQLNRSLRSIRTIELTPQDLRRRELAVPFTKRIIVPTMLRFGRVGRRLTPASVVERLDRELTYAGSPAGWDAERVLATKIVTTIGGFALGMLLTRLLELQSIQSIIVMALLTFAGYYLPEWVIRSRSGKRQKSIQRALPDALDLLSITVEAGLAFDAALSRVARHAGGPIGEEFFRVLQEMQIGKSRSESMRDLGERTTVPELKAFVLAMIQADVFGISIAKVLHVQAQEMRIKRRQRAEEQAQKVPVKIIFPLLFCIFPALFIVLLGPAAITIYRNVLQTP